MRQSINEVRDVPAKIGDSGLIPYAHELFNAFDVKNFRFYPLNLCISAVITRCHTSV